MSELEDRTSLGQWWPSFTVSPPSGITEEAFEPVYRECDAKNSRYVMYVYSNQPAAREALAASLESHAVELKGCLVDMGGSDVEDMTLNELWGALKDQSFGGEEYGYSRRKDCIIDAGINW